MKIEREEGLVVAVAGMPRSGKSTWIRSQVKEHPRVLAWDTRGEYAADGFELITSPRKLLETLRGNAGPGRYAYRDTTLATFDLWCWAAHKWLMYAPTTTIGDELADVTNPGKAPPWWGTLIRTVAGYGGYLFGASQFPSESEKTIWRSAQLLHCHRLIERSDCELMAKRINCEPEVIASLPPYAYVERESDSAEYTRGGP